MEVVIVATAEATIRAVIRVEAEMEAARPVMVEVTVVGTRL